MRRILFITHFTPLSFGEGLGGEAVGVRLLGGEAAGVRL